MYETLILPIDQPSALTLTTLTGFAALENNPDLIWLTPEPEKHSITIDQVHNLQQDLQLKPFGENHKVAIIAPAHLLTLPAQQALLKLLEEPPENTQIMLCSSLPHKLLPTILSRASLTKVQGEVALATSLYGDLTHLSVSECLKQSDEWSKSREEAITRLVSLVSEIRQMYLTNPTAILLAQEKAVITCIEQLERNINAKLALDHLLFQLSGHIIP